MLLFIQHFGKFYSLWRWTLHIEKFWSWDYGRNFTKYKTFILWLKRKGLCHLMRQKMNWAGRKRNRCLEKRSKGLLFAMNTAAIDLHWEEFQGFCCSFKMWPMAYTCGILMLYIAVLDLQGHSGQSCLLSWKKEEKNY